MLRCTLLFLLSVFFLSSLHAQNPQLMWVKSFGNSAIDYPYEFALDSQGNVIIIGFFQDTVDFDPGVNVFNLVSNGSSDAFILKLANNGNFLWAKSFGGEYNDVIGNVTTDIYDNIYISGGVSGSTSMITDTVDIDPGPGVYEIITTNDYGSGFFEKLDSDGNLIFANNLGGQALVDSEGNIYLGGRFKGTFDFDPSMDGVVQATSNGWNDVFIEKLDPQGNFLWVKTFGTNNSDSFLDFVLDSDEENLFITGYFEGTMDIDPGPNSFIISSGYSSVFNLKLDSSGNFIWANHFVGQDHNEYARMTIDSENSIYITGVFYSSVDFDPDQISEYILTSSGWGDIFICKLDSTGAFVWAKQIGGEAWKGADEITFDSDDNIIATGGFMQTIDFDPGDNVYELANGNLSYFMLKVEPDSGNFIWAISSDENATGSSWGKDIMGDSHGYLFTLGYLTGTEDFNNDSTETTALTSNGDRDIFIMKHTSKGVSTNVENISKSLIVYPNPAYDFISIEGAEIRSIQLLNVQGEIIKEIAPVNHIIDISNVRSGIYILKALSKSDTFINKIIIQ